MRQACLQLLLVLVSVGCRPSARGVGEADAAAIMGYEAAGFANLSRIGTVANAFVESHEGMAPGTFADLSDMLSSSLALADSKERPCQGYFFRVFPGSARHEFYVVATPAEYGRTGRVTFLLSFTGEVFSRDLEGRELDAVPFDAERPGWTKRRGKAVVTVPEE